MTKLCLITPFPPEEDGLAEYAKRFVDALISKTNVSVNVVCRKHIGEGKRFINKTNLKVLPVWKPKSLTNQLSVWRAILRSRPDIVDIHYGPYSEYGGLFGEPLAFLTFLLRLSGLRVALTLHSIWLPHEASERAFEHTRKGLLSIMAGIYYWMFMLFFFQLFNRLFMVVIFKNSPITAAVRKEFRLSSCKIAEIVHGAPQPLYNPLLKSSSKIRLGLQGKYVLLTFGFIRRDKGIDLAVESLSSLDKSCVLIVAGRPITSEDKKYMDDLHILTEQLDLTDRVKFDTRFIPESDLKVYLNAADALLLPYRRRVGPSGPLALSASYGLPVIAVNDGKFLVNTNSFVYLLKDTTPLKLREAISVIAEERQTMTTRAISYASKYCFKNTTQEYLHALAQI